MTRYSIGDIIIKEGDADRNLFKFYIVEEGEARAYVREDGEDVLMSHLRAGEKEAIFLYVAFTRKYFVCASFCSDCLPQGLAVLSGNGVLVYTRTSGANNKLRPNEQKLK